MSERSRDEAERAQDGEFEEAGESFGDIIRTIIYALLIALTFRTLLFQPFSIPSGSMKPTLLIGDYLFVSKYSYGYSKYALPYGNLLPDSMFGGRLFGGQPARGDVIVFRNPANEDEDYIKRLVGLPGDEVQMKRGVLHVNGDPVRLERVASFIEPNAPGHTKCVRSADLDRFGVEQTERDLILADRGRSLCLKVQFMETLPGGKRHPVLDADGPFNRLDDTPPITVPPGRYFFMGDNRDNSQDSRLLHGGIGLVPEQNLIGRAELILLSSDGPFWQFWNWRSDRFFKSIE